MTAKDLVKSVSQEQCDTLRRRGFRWGVHPNVLSHHTEYKQARLFDVCGIEYDSGTAAATIGRAYKELYWRGAKPASK